MPPHDPAARYFAARSIPGLAPRALRLAVPLAAGTLAGLALVPPLGLALAAATAAVLYFFRDPERDPPPSGVVAPADGRVSVVREEGERLRVGVFLNVTDVHVVRAPAAARVDRVVRRPGANRPAFSKGSERNERVRILCSAGDDPSASADEADPDASSGVDPDTPTAYDLELIAGWFARRIHPYAAPGDALARGGRVGHIDFGSRVDVVLPPAVDRDDLAVAEGTPVRAGETVLADP